MYYSQSIFYFELSYVVSLILDSISQNFPKNPAFLTKYRRVQFWFQFCSFATSGRNVPEQAWSPSVPFIMIPCFPTYQPQISGFYLKLISSDTPTLKSFTSSLVTAGNLGSFIDALIAQSGNTMDSLPGENVPIQPLNQPFFFQVTNIGTSLSASLSGN